MLHAILQSINKISNVKIHGTNQASQCTMSVHFDFLQSGDLLFFKSYGSLPGSLVEWACYSPWCHVALVVTLPTHLIVNGCTVAYKGSVCVWESATGCDIPSLLPQKDGNYDKKKGIILTPIESRLRGCGIVGIQKLKYNGKGGREEERQVRETISHKLLDHIIRYHEECYERHPLDFVSVWCHSIFCLNACCLSVEPPPCTSSTDSFFCSEIVAKALIDAGVIRKYRREDLEREYWDHQGDRLCLCGPVPEQCLCFVDCSNEHAVEPGEFTVSDLSDNCKLNAYYLNAKHFRYATLIESNGN